MDSSDARPVIPWSFQDHLDFVKAFERYPALWDTRSGYYKNPVLVNKAFETLIGKFPLYFNNKDDVQKKIKSLKVGYRKDMKKAVIESFTGVKRKRSEWLFIADRFFKHWGNFAGGDDDDESDIKIENNTNETTISNPNYLPSPSDSSLREQSLLSDDEYQQYDSVDDRTSLASLANDSSQQQLNNDQQNDNNNHSNSFELSSSNLNPSSSDNSVYNQIIKMEPEFLETEVNFSQCETDSLPASHQISTNIIPEPCSSQNISHYLSPQIKRKRKDNFCQQDIDGGSSLTSVFESILSEGLRSLASKRSNSSDESTSDFRVIERGDRSHSKDGSDTKEDEKKHPDYYFYEFIKDLTLNWTGEQRRKLRNKFNQVLEEIESEVEKDRLRNRNSSC